MEVVETSTCKQYEVRQAYISWPDEVSSGLAGARTVKAKAKVDSVGEDVLLQLPVGTVIREISREDPAMEEEENADAAEQADNNIQGQWRRDKWVLYPSSIPSDYANTEFPPIPRPRRSNLLQAQPVTPIDLDLSKPMEKPMLLAAGAAGGLGNPHFATKTIPRPKFASKGGRGVTITLELELKLLADVGFVGLPNAGKSTLLRALSNSRTRIGDWAFTTLQPSIGTVVLDNHKGRPLLDVGRANGGARTQFSVADIPGLIPDAHLDRGLGLGFLRHVERAQVLALVIDLSTGDAIHALQNLWRELGAFERLRDREINEQTESRIVDWRAFGNPASRVIPDNKAISTGTSDLIESASASRTLPALQSRPISTKPWFVVATKADIAGTQTNFGQLKGYLEALSSGTLEHPSGQKNGWKGRVATFPVSAIRGEGVDRIPEWIVNLLDS